MKFLNVKSVMTAGKVCGVDLSIFCRVLSKEVIFGGNRFVWPEQGGFVELCSYSLKVNAISSICGEIAQ